MDNNCNNLIPAWNVKKRKWLLALHLFGWMPDAPNKSWRWSRQHSDFRSPIYRGENSASNVHLQNCHIIDRLCCEVDGQYLRFWSPDCQGMLDCECNTRRGGEIGPPQYRNFTVIVAGKFDCVCLTTWINGCICSSRVLKIIRNPVLPECFPRDAHRMVSFH